jgi:hypothetical protein
LRDLWFATAHVPVDAPAAMAHIQLHFLVFLVFYQHFLERISILALVFNCNVGVWLYAASAASSVLPLLLSLPPA